MKKIIIKIKKLKIKKVPHLFPAFTFSFICGMFLLLFAQPAIMNTKVPTDSIRSKSSGEKVRLEEEAVNTPHPDLHRGRPSPSIAIAKTSANLGRFIPDEQIYAEMDDPVEETAKEDKSASRINYHKKHILVKFSPEVEDEIEQGNKPNIPHELKRMISRGKVRQIEVGEGESVEKLLEKYNTEHSHLIQYAQLDYECEAQGMDTYSLIGKKKILALRDRKAGGKLWKEDEIDEFKKLLDNRKGNPHLFGFIETGADYAIEEYFFSGDPLKNDQFLWHLDDINIRVAWDETSGDPSVVIAVIDTGVAYEDADLQEHEYSRVASLSDGYKKAPGLQNSNLWINSREVPENNVDDDRNGYVDDVNGYDFIDGDGYPHDDNGHGTSLTNLIAYNFEENTIGLASQCSLMILKVLDHRGRGFSSTLAEGIYYAADHGANVINLSVAWPPGLDPGPVVSEAIAYAAKAGAVIVAGTGNNSRNKICYPAAYDEVIAVGATRLDRARAYYSNYGYKLEIMAPGGNNYLDLNLDGYPDGILQETFQPRYHNSSSGEILADPSSFGYEFLHGTSMATAIVTGVVGLMISIDPGLDLIDIRNILYNTATDLGPAGWDKEYGYGLINAGEAVAHICYGWENKDNKWNDAGKKNKFRKKKSKGQDSDDYQDPTWPEEDPNNNIDNNDDGLDQDNNQDYPGYPGQPCPHPDCLNDLEIEAECDSCLNDEEIEGECLPLDDDEEDEC